MGSKKMEIKRITNMNARKATFFKRQRDLFHKADEYCSKSGAQIAVTAFSLADNPFMFGHPSADYVIDRYCSPGKQTLSDTTQVVLDENQGLGGSDVVDEEKVKFWWDEPIEGMELEELKQYARCVEDELEETKMRKYCTKDFLANWV